MQETSRHNTIPPTELQELFRQISEGDEVAFRTLFYQFLPQLQPFIFRFIKSGTAAQEILQETFVRIWLSRDKLAAITNPASWIFKVASNECYNYARKMTTQQKVLKLAPVLVEQADTTNEQANLNDLKRLVHETIEQLSPQRRKIYTMSRDEGKSIQEIAEELQISPNTVKNTLVTTLRTIREHLNKNGIVFSLFIILFGKK